MPLSHNRPLPRSGRRRSDSRSAATLKTGVAAAAASVLVLGGGGALSFALANQHHAPRPSPAAAGSLAAPAQPSSLPRTNRRAPSPTTTAPRTPAPPVSTGPVVARSRPMSITIPAIGVASKLLTLGVNPDGTIEVPPLNDTPATDQAAWFKYSPTPGQLGASVIEGHIDSVYQGPSVFFRLGALRPGDRVEVTLADGVVAVFAVDGVRQFAKSSFPTSLLYGDPGKATLRLVTCGGSFDAATHQYLSNIIVSAHLVSAHRGSSS